MHHLAPDLGFQSCFGAPGYRVLIFLSKVKEMAFKALLGLAAIIITEATDGPSFTWLLEGRGY